jgi:hypothetical protein
MASIPSLLLSSLYNRIGKLAMLVRSSQKVVQKLFQWQNALVFSDYNCSSNYKQSKDPTRSLDSEIFTFLTA